MNGYDLVLEALDDKNFDVIAKQVIKDISFVVPLLKKYIAKQNRSYLKEIHFEATYWDRRHGIDDYNLITYTWSKWAEPNDNYVNFMSGIEQVVIDNLKRKGWKYTKGKRGESGKLVRKYMGELVTINLYVGDNDGNNIGPDFID